jgi:hypothetical protein
MIIIVVVVVVAIIISRGQAARRASRRVRERDRERGGGETEGEADEKRGKRQATGDRQGLQYLAAPIYTFKTDHLIHLLSHAHCNTNRLRIFY